MRFKNSLAAAVAAGVSAVVFSAAFQPAEATLIVIDDFTQATGTTSVTGTSATDVTASASAAITGPLFNTRVRTAYVSQSPTRQGRTVLSSVGSGVGTLTISTSGTTTADVIPVGEFNYNNPFGTVDLLAATAGDFQGFKIVTGATNSSSTGLLGGYVYAYNNNNGTSSIYYLPSGAFWAPNTTYSIPFTSFTGDANFASIEGVSVGFDQYASGPSTVLPGNVAYNATAQFTLIAVPEPTHLVSVAGIGAAYGAWRLRKLRRSRTAAGDAVAG